MPERIPRRTLLAAATAALAGCVGATDDATDDDGTEGTSTDSGADNPAAGDVAQRGDLELTSSAFADGERIPDRYARAGENVNPPLSIRNAQDATESFALVVDDPDAVEPAGEVWLHWLVWNVPAATTEIPVDWQPSTAVEGRNDFGNRGYDGPAPPDQAHTYRFKCFALDTTLSLDDDPSKRAVGRAMTDHVLAATQLEGTHAP